MNNEIYCSTGTFTGRRNGRNHRLAIEYGNLLNCDGFEVMIFDDWYDRLDTVVRDYKASGVICRTIHADKDIGGLVSSEGKENMDKASELWKINCNAGAEMGAKKVVAHTWGLPHSDKYSELIYERCGRLMEIANEYGLDLVVENIPCNYGSPIGHLEDLARIYPKIGLIIDTRWAQFHSEMEKICRSFIWASGNVRHIHISEYAGGHKDWNSMRVIPQPGKGNVDYPMFFKHLKTVGYSGSLTLEAPSAQKEEGVDVLTLNESLDFIKNRLFGC